MSDILRTILAAKRDEVSAIKSIYSESALRDAALDSSRKTVSLRQSILSGSGIIAEFKRRSPSKGEIFPMADVSVVTAQYEAGGASGCSVLTDTRFFGGSLTDFAIARRTVGIPLLRKDFIIDPVQIYMARIYGADTILLIASALGKDEIESLCGVAKELSLEVLLELHTPEEVEKWTPLADLTGVNSRNLRNFSTSLDTAAQFASLLPKDSVKIAESGIHSPADIAMLREKGYRGFLIGEAFMSTPQPGETLKRFINDSKQ